MPFARMRKRLARLSVLDVVTAIVLIIAVFLFVRPGSALHASVSRWRDLRDTQRAAERNWRELAAVATPLYAGEGEPELIEFSDYECPFCRSASPAIDSAVAAGVRVSLVHLPLRIHASARPAALAAICAERVGRFAEAHRFFMTTTAWRTDTAWARLPGFTELAEMPAFSGCLTDPEAEARLQQHLGLAHVLQIDATPRFVSRSAVLTEPPTMANLIALSRRK